MDCWISLLLITYGALAAVPFRNLTVANNDGVTYHAVPAGPEIRPYVVAPAREPKLDDQAAWKLLRTRVKYVFVIYQENRSFDSYFGTFPGADGLFSRPATQTLGFNQELINTDGTLTTIHPFRIGPEQFAADTDDIDHSHQRIVEKMDVINGHPGMDRFAFDEERKYSPTGNPSLKAKQYGELAMAYMDGDTVPFLWRYADRFVLFDHIFQQMTGPSTPGNLSIIAAQSGQTQWVLHPDQIPKPGRTKGAPVFNDDDPLWGSILDPVKNLMPTNPLEPTPARKVQDNLKFASLPLSLQGAALKQATTRDSDPDDDLEDVTHDITAITNTGKPTTGFGWYQEGFNHEPTDKDDDDGPVDAMGRHASYITHHNGPQYFGYIANNPVMRQGLHGLDDFYADLRHESLPAAGGVFYLKGGYHNQLGLKPADPDPRVQKNFLGDDDHPEYSDAQISEVMVAQTINRIAQSPYWNQCAIILTWDDSEGDYDHLPPPIRSTGPDGLPMSDGPRVPLLVMSPYSRVHYVAHAQGSHASVVKFVDHLFDLIPLAQLPDEFLARQLGEKKFGQLELGPADAITPNMTDLLDAFDPARLAGQAPPLPRQYITIPDDLLHTLPQISGYGLKDIGITPIDKLLGIKNEIPDDFNPRPSTTPTPGK
jgi:phospholipase C